MQGLQRELFLLHGTCDAMFNTRCRTTHFEELLPGLLGSHQLSFAEERPDGLLCVHRTAMNGRAVYGTETKSKGTAKGLSKHDARRAA